LRVAVTGARGFVGSHLSDMLRARGHEVVGLTRDADGASVTDEFTAIRSYADEPSLKTALQGVDAVVHLAARVHVMRENAADPAAEFNKANVDSTRALARVLAEAGGGHLILMSSIKVFGDSGVAFIDRNTKPAPSDPYGRSKYDAEQVLGEFTDGGLRWTVIRPPLVYGAGVGGNFRRLLSLARLSSRVPLPLGGIRNARSLVYVGNLCDLVIHSLESDRAHGQRLLVSDGAPVSTTELIRRLAAAMDRRALLVPVPTGLLRAAGAVTGRGAEVGRMVDSLEADVSETTDLVGWRPRFTLDEGLRETVRWWTARANG
jgi:nucleoside-diphosphate-sugar epimerase